MVDVESLFPFLYVSVCVGIYLLSKLELRLYSFVPFSSKVSVFRGRFKFLVSCDLQLFLGLHTVKLYFSDWKSLSLFW